MPLDNNNRALCHLLHSMSPDAIARAFCLSANQVEILSVAVLGSIIEDVGLVAKLIERRVTTTIVQVIATRRPHHDLEYV